jgi:DNA-binding PadR family transcriptional regulator
MDVQHRKQLSIGQIKLLGLVAKFRFVTVELISSWRDKSKATIYERLAILEDQGYLQKRYEKSWKLLGRPAVYSLTGKGLRMIRDHKPGYFTDAVIRNQYKNRSASLQLVDHSLDVAKLCVQLFKQYDSTYDIFAKSEIDRFEAFMRPLPDLYIRTNRKDEADQAIHYQLETIEAGTFTWMIKKRINAHQDWFDDNNDEDWSFEDNYPHLLLVCDNKSTEKRIHRLTDNSMMDFETWTTTRERFELGEKKIWLHYYDEDEMEYVGL